MPSPLLRPIERFSERNRRPRPPRLAIRPSIKHSRHNPFLPPGRRESADPTTLGAASFCKFPGESDKFWCSPSVGAHLGRLPIERDGDAGQWRSTG